MKYWSSEWKRIDIKPDGPDRWQVVREDGVRIGWGLVGYRTAEQVREQAAVYTTYTRRMSAWPE